MNVVYVVYVSKLVMRRDRGIPTTPILTAVIPIIRVGYGKKGYGSDGSNEPG